MDTHGGDFKAQVLGLIFAGVPAGSSPPFSSPPPSLISRVVNSLDSILMSLDRPLQYAQLLKMQKKLGKETVLHPPPFLRHLPRVPLPRLINSQFEVVPMSYFSNQRISLTVTETPLDKECDSID